MNVKLVAFRVLLVLNIVSYACSERKRQLMSDSEIIDSINENIFLLLKFARIISTKKSEQARKKCAIALKNLKTLNSATENGSLHINPLTTITLNGLIWHLDPCNDTNHIVRHIELYNLIKSSDLFKQISNLEQNNSNNKQVSTNTSTKSYFPQNKDNRFKNNIFRTSSISKPHIKHQALTKVISQETQSRLNSSVVNGTDNNRTAIILTFNATNILDTNETGNSYTQNNTSNYRYSGKDSISKELQELSKMKPVSSKSASGFSQSLSRILSERSVS